MKDWFSKSLGDAMLVDESLNLLEEFLSSVYESAGNPNDMATFTRHESEGRLHCEVVIYFSPNSVAVAREVNAQPCGKPSPDSLSMFVGTQESWSTLFPELAR